MFSEEKVAQMAAYLLLKRGGRMAYLKLIKLLYLANRECLVKHGRMMGEDALFSLPHGPVMSTTLDVIKGKTAGTGVGDYWDTLISTCKHDVLLKDAVKDSDPDDLLDELSLSDVKILDDIFAKYGHWDRYQLRDATHLKHVCPEWHDPNGSRLVIDPTEIFTHEGKSQEEAENIVHNLKEASLLREFSAQLK